MREFGRERNYGSQGSRRPDREAGGFGRGNNSDRFSRPSSGGFRGGRRDEKMMHRVVCDGCKKDCEVPFKPTDGKPVYCNDCFKGREKSDSRDSGRSRPSNQHDYKEDLEKMNHKIGMILDLLESMKKMQMSSNVEPAAEEKPKKAAVKKKTTKKKE
ncbi:MAG: CxxC-x17-CxxC domain-containing protein [Nanoarchaeota archaeon]